MLKRNLLSKKRMLVLAMVLFFVAICFGITPGAIAGSICAGDFNFDNDVDGSDLSVFATEFERTDCPSAGPAPVEKSGYTISYATGDDGDLEKGVAWPNPRFTDNGDGTVTDNLTGLIWLKNVNCFGDTTWAEALADCNSLDSGSCGLTDGSVAGDWRLPNIKELISLIHYGTYNPALPDTAGTGQWSEGDPFSNGPFSISYYWSSTSDISYSDDAWVMRFYEGYITSRAKGTYAGKVWPVRDGH